SVGMAGLAGAGGLGGPGTIRGAGGQGGRPGTTGSATVIKTVSKTPAASPDSTAGQALVVHDCPQAKPWTPAESSTTPPESDNFEALASPTSKLRGNTMSNTSFEQLLSKLGLSSDEIARARSTTLDVSGPTHINCSD